MSNRTKRGLSFVIGDSGSSENHILPVNSIQYSSYSNEIFTGGRDGVVKLWTPTKSDIGEDEFEFNSSGGKQNVVGDQDMDEMLLKLETSISSNPVPYIKSKNHDYGVRSSFNLHFDWINDIKLVNNDRSLITCSSDLSMKFVKLRLGSDSANEKEFIHRFPSVHTDYIRKLSYVNRANCIISGGLDGQVVLWDLHSLKPTQQIQNRAVIPSGQLSIYALANDGANIVGTGGPSNTVNLYDHRAPPSANFVRSLIGHQDNVRCLLMNDRFVLSGSSDTSIKLWDLRMFKVYKNFEVHDDAVWSLSTPMDSSPGLSNQVDQYFCTEFDTFYSGDKSGRIVKTDLRYLNKHEPLSPSETYFASPETTAIDERIGLSTIVAKSDSPILSLCLETEVLSLGKFSSPTLFASTYHSFDRYVDPDTEQLSQYQYLREHFDFSVNYEKLNDELAVGLMDSAAGEQNDLNSDFYDLVSRLTMDTGNLDIQSSISAINHPLSANNADEEKDPNAIYTSMFLNVNGGPSMEYINEGNQDPHELVDETPVEILLNPVSPDRIVSIAFNKRTMTLSKLVPRSIIARRFLSNKRQILVLYLDGDITLWDLFICQVKKNYSMNSSTALQKSDIEARIRDMDEIYQAHQTDDIFSNWCEAEIKAGKLMVTLSESSLTSVEVYQDELVKDYPFLAPTHPDNLLRGLGNESSITNDHRFYLTSLFLNSLFQYYILYEWEFDARLRERLVEDRDEPNHAPSNDLERSNTVSASSFRRLKQFGRTSSRSSVAQLKEPSAPSNGSIVSNNGSLTERSSHISQSVASFLHSDEVKFRPDDSIMTLLRAVKTRYAEKAKAGHQLDSLLNTFYSVLDEVYRPLFGAKRLPANMDIILFESSPNLGNLRDLCSFTVGDLLRLGTDGGSPSLINDLRANMPEWLGRALLFSKYPVRESPKIGFHLLEVDYLLLPPDKRIGGKSQKKIRKLPTLETSIKMTSHSMLRVNKILLYVTEKFDSKTTEMKEKIAPVDWLVLECKGRQLSPDMTLQTIKTKIWKSSSDIELRFRRKFDE